MDRQESQKVYSDLYRAYRDAGDDDMNAQCRLVEAGANNQEITNAVKAYGDDNEEDDE